MGPRPLVPVLGVFIGGILSAQAFSCPKQIPCVVLAFLILLVILCLPFIGSSSKAVSGCVLVLFFLAGAMLEFLDRPDRPLENAAGADSIATIEGTLLEPPRQAAGVVRLTVRVDHVFPDSPLCRPGAKAYVSVYGERRSFKPGTRLRFPARLRPFRNFNNPGRYDYEKAMEIKGFSCAATVSDGRRIVRMGRGSLGVPGDQLEALRGPLREWFSRELPVRKAGLFRALVLGERQAVSRDLRETFQNSGLAHMLAVSGLHVGLVAWLAFGLLKALLSRSTRLLLAWEVRKAAAALTIFPVTLYALTAGFQVSTQRAWLMVLAYLFSILAGREKDVWSTLSLAALLILASHPRALETISFQLSFGAVVGILRFAPPIYRKVPIPWKGREGRAHRILHRVLDAAWGLISVTVAASLFLLPLTVYYFHQIPLGAVPANLMAAPLLGLWILPLGLCGVSLHSLGIPVAEFFLQAASAGLELLVRIVRFWGEPEWSSAWVVTPTEWEVVLAYGWVLLGLFSLKRRWRPGFALMSLVLLADVGYWVHESRLRQDLRVTYLDVGQGNAALVQFPGGERMLVDGGGFRFGDFDVGKMVVAPFLWRQKIARVDYLVLSHPQADHMNGLTFIAENFAPSELWSNGDRVSTESYCEFMAAVTGNAIKIRLPGDQGMPETIGRVGVEVLHPPPGPPPDTVEQDLNDRSVVVRLTFEGHSFLFPGDLGRVPELELSATVGPGLASEILLAPHHGSGSSCTSTFLSLVRPEWCIVSCGAGNSLGLPHPMALSRIRESGARILRTDREGAVKVCAGRYGIRVRTFRSGALP